MTVSTAQITAQLEAILAKDASARVVAIRSATRQDWPATVEKRGRRFSVKWCESLLALREALADSEPTLAEDAGLVVMTPFATVEIADDIAARLTKARVYQPEGWAIVRELFQAKDTDARLSSYAWMPQLLIDAAGQEGYPPVASAFLDLETGWHAILQRYLQLDAARPDAEALLLWTQQPDASLLLQRLPPEAQTDVLAWLAASAGNVGRLVLACLKGGSATDALPLGLACEVIFSTDVAGQPERGHAAIRLERFVADTHISMTEGQDWARAAKQLLSRQETVHDLRGALDRADALLQELRIADFAYLSAILPGGFDQRLLRFAHQLQHYLANPSPNSAAMVEKEAQRVQEHKFASLEPTLRADQVQMACRLVRWLLQPMPTRSDVASAVAWQADEGAFVDWARFRLLGGDDLAEVSAAYAQLRAQVISRRNAYAQSVANTLADSQARKLDLNGGDANGRIVPVESVLERVVGPLASQHPVLLLVIDGLSVSIFRELFTRPERLGWTEWVVMGNERPLVGLAAFPTITEVSRASLLCGKLTTAASSQEKSGFTFHPVLLSHSHSSSPPRLFHKGELADDGNLSNEVRSAIANPQQKVVGVVYNAVDDHLSGPDQLHQYWRLESLRLLLPLLREARDARRVVIVTADHGHLLEDGTQVLAGGTGSDRWRLADSASSEQEVVLHGGRVVTSAGVDTVVCLWGESSRYLGRKNGYHGGVSPQEITVPLSVFAPSGMAIANWQPALPAQPEWWDQPVLVDRETAIPVTPKRSISRRVAAPSEIQGALFDVESAPELVQQTAAEDWITVLLASTVYNSQRQLAARVAISDEQMRRLLEALNERGGKLSRSALAQRLGVPEMRLGGLLSAVRRMLNVDQAAILQIDEHTGTVELNRALLLEQFRIAKG